jgi:hypothetical protein
VASRARGANGRDGPGPLAIQISRQSIGAEAEDGSHCRVGNNASGPEVEKSLCSDGLLHGRNAANSVFVWVNVLQAADAPDSRQHLHTKFICSDTDGIVTSLMCIDGTLPISSLKHECSALLSIGLYTPNGMTLYSRLVNTAHNRG